MKMASEKKKKNLDFNVPNAEEENATQTKIGSGTVQRLYKHGSAQLVYCL